MQKKAFALLPPRGAVLIIALWSLSVLAVFAVSLALGLRQKITLVSRLENRDKVHLALEACARKAVAIINSEEVDGHLAYSSAVKMDLHNNGRFSGITVNDMFCEVSYPAGEKEEKQYFGVVDEERKINVNRVGLFALSNLIRNVLKCPTKEAEDMAGDILDWRQSGESELTGFASDDYYKNLQYPYPPKNADYELMDELLLVKGIDEKMLKKLSGFITVYGEGKVNINTAPAEVLSAFGLNDGLVDKIMEVRRGEDGKEATSDDFIFLNTADIIGDLKNAVQLADWEVRQMEGVISREKLTTRSAVFTIQAKARKSENDETVHQLTCVFDSARNKIEYWKEQ